jgi:hypothetical protein
MVLATWRQGTNFVLFQLSPLQITAFIIYAVVILFSTPKSKQ